ncbi:hypothetical protein GCM10025876_28570 [Demequina litorisediminis]|uniref:Uncharacterized protein n=1 Tax=Demequina litorisediminis TaxID=1849022 RepID=A0ABQ6IFH8_9MICO|nr:hypothetical protein GCM10025876_28570 [Demequina litorisediminis]
MDVNASGTRREEILVSPEEPQGHVEACVACSPRSSRRPRPSSCWASLRENKTNAEFLMQVAKTTPGKDDVDNELTSK